MNNNVLNELTQILRNKFEAINGCRISMELFDTMADELNTTVHELYAKHGLFSDRKIDRDMIIYIFNMLIESGAIELSDNDEIVIDGKSEAAPNDSVAGENDAYTQNGDNSDYIELLKAMWQQYVNNRQFIEAEAVMAAINSMNSSEHVCSEDEDFPEGWGENLVGNFDAEHWANEFKVVLNLKPCWLQDVGYLTGWFSNAIMTGYDKAKQEEFPVAERREEDYVYVEFYDIKPNDNIAMFTEEEVSEFTFKFQTLAAAKEFVKLNAFGKTFKSKYYRYYQLEPTTTLKKMEIK